MDCARAQRARRGAAGAAGRRAERRAPSAGQGGVSADGGARPARLLSSRARGLAASVHTPPALASHRPSARAHLGIEQPASVTAVVFHVLPVRVRGAVADHPVALHAVPLQRRDTARDCHLVDERAREDGAAAAARKRGAGLAHEVACAGGGGKVGAARAQRGGSRRGGAGLSGAKRGAQRAHARVSARARASRAHAPHTAVSAAPAARPRSCSRLARPTAPPGAPRSAAHPAARPGGARARTEVERHLVRKSLQQVEQVRGEDPAVVIHDQHPLDLPRGELGRRLDGGERGQEAVLRAQRSLHAAPSAASRARTWERRGRGAHPAPARPQRGRTARSDMAQVSGRAQPPAPPPPEHRPAPAGGSEQRAAGRSRPAAQRATRHGRSARARTCRCSLQKNGSRLQQCFGRWLGETSIVSRHPPPCARARAACRLPPEPRAVARGGEQGNSCTRWGCPPRAAPHCACAPHLAVTDGLVCDVDAARRVVRAPRLRGPQRALRQRVRRHHDEQDFIQAEREAAVAVMFVLHECGRVARHEPSTVGAGGGAGKRRGVELARPWRQPARSAARGQRRSVTGGALAAAAPRAARALAHARRSRSRRWRAGAVGGIRVAPNRRVLARVSSAC